MSEAAVMEIGRQALQVAMMVSLPLLLASLLTGILVSLLQVATSIQDVTLTFVPKIIAVGAALVLASTWMVRVLVEFTRDVFLSLPQVVG